MRVLSHPAVEDITLEGILYALADPVRAEIFSQLSQSACAQNCVSFIAIKGKTLPKSTLSQHIRVLREAGLIRSERKGVELHNTPRCAELRERFGDLVPKIIDAYRSHREPKRKRKGS